MMDWPVEAVWPQCHRQIWCWNVDGQKLYPLCDNPFRGGDAEYGMFVIIFRAARVAAPAATEQ